MVQNTTKTHCEASVLALGLFHAAPDLLVLGGMLLLMHELQERGLQRLDGSQVQLWCSFTKVDHSSMQLRVQKRQGVAHARGLLQPGLGADVADMLAMRLGCKLISVQMGSAAMLALEVCRCIAGLELLDESFGCFMHMILRCNLAK